MDHRHCYADQEEHKDHLGCCLCGKAASPLLRFFLEATPSERREIMEQVARDVVEEQRATIGVIPPPEKPAPETSQASIDTLTGIVREAAATSGEWWAS